MDGIGEIRWSENDDISRQESERYGEKRAGKLLLEEQKVF